MSSSDIVLAAAGAGAPPTYIEDVFSTWLYTGTSATQTITNGIDLAGKGGMIWFKGRDTTFDHYLFDTVRGIAPLNNFSISSNNTNAQTNHVNGFGPQTVLSNGFTIGEAGGAVNGSGSTYVSWTFREQPKFFDVVTYTGNATNGRTITHNLGSVPGMIIIKRLNTTSNWNVYHRSLPSGNRLRLNLTSTQTDISGANFFGNGTIPVDPTSTVFTIGDNPEVNADGSTYVAYLFAHNAGGFGVSGNDNVISCGSFTTDGSGNATVNLGYEPQYLLAKPTSSSGAWIVFDVMRNWSQTQFNYLLPNSTSAEFVNDGAFGNPTATGFEFKASLAASTTYIYMAIRRGPMKTPTSGTSVFSPLAVNNLQNTVNTTGFPIDLQWYGNRSGGSSIVTVVDRLRGVSTNTTQQANYLVTSSTAAEVTTPGNLTSNFWTNTTFRTTSLADGANAIWYSFRRAPGFMDVVCYTGDNSQTVRDINHNLGVVPELAIIKGRNNAVQNWFVAANMTPTGYDRLLLNLTNAAQNFTPYSAGFDGQPTSTVFKVRNSPLTNDSGTTYVAYLFASVAGVSKVGSYTGTGTTQVINCGFTTGARFILIRRTDSTGDWYVWNSARGIVAGNDPYLLLNSTAAEVTNTDYVDTASTGFEISSTAPADINANGGTFIFLAIA